MQAEHNAPDHGNPNWVQERAFARQLARFNSNHEKRGPDECWPWTGRTYSKGYGQFNGLQSTYAHKAAWKLANDMAMIPEGHEIHHECRNPGCVNPRHLRCLSRIEHRQLHDRIRREARGNDSGVNLSESDVISHVLNHGVEPKGTP